LVFPLSEEPESWNFGNTCGLTLKPKGILGDHGLQPQV
jgi:hypothetical protein